MATSREEGTANIAEPAVGHSVEAADAYESARHAVQTAAARLRDRLDAASASAEMTDHVDRLVKRHPYAATVIAVVAGVLLGWSLKRISANHLPGKPTTLPPIDD